MSDNEPPGSPRQIAFLRAWLREHGRDEGEMIFEAMDARLAKMKRRIDGPPPPGRLADLNRQIAKAEARYADEEDPKERILTLRQICTLERWRADEQGPWKQKQDRARFELAALKERHPEKTPVDLDALSQSDVGVIFDYLNTDHAAGCDLCKGARQAWRKEKKKPPPRQARRAPVRPVKPYHTSFGEVYHTAAECPAGRHIKPLDYCEGDNPRCFSCSPEYAEIRADYPPAPLRPCKQSACSRAARSGTA